MQAQVEGLNDAERELLGEALTDLRRKRAVAWNAKCDDAEAQGKRRPSLQAYGIDEIKRLARKVGTRALHWTDER